MTDILRPSPRATLRDDHARVDVLLRRLVAGVRAGDMVLAAGVWCDVEATILRHLDAEEMFLFPELATSHAHEVAALRREHDALRARLAEVALSFDLPRLRVTSIDELCVKLKRHAEREEHLAYEIADAVLPAPERAAVARRVSRTTRAVSADARVAPTRS